jgi:hypothetical protein
MMSRPPEVAEVKKLMQKQTVVAQLPEIGT